MAIQQPLAIVNFANINKDFAWYIVVTRFNYEAKFTAELLEYLKNNPELLDYFDDIFIPEKKCIVEYKNVKNKIARRTITDKTMSLYVFVKVKMNEHIYGIIRNIIGCATILAVGDALVTVSDEEALQHRQDADITEDTMKGLSIYSKVNPFFNPLLPLKGIASDQQKIIIVKKSAAKQDNLSNTNIVSDMNVTDVNALSTNVNINVEADAKINNNYKPAESLNTSISNISDNITDRDIVTTRLKAERIANIDDIDPDFFFKKLQSRSLIEKFLSLSGKDVSFLSDVDLQKLQRRVEWVRKKQAQREVMSNLHLRQNNSKRYNSSKKKAYRPDTVVSSKNNNTQKKSLNYKYNIQSQQVPVNVPAQQNKKKHQQRRHVQNYYLMQFHHQQKQASTKKQTQQQKKQQHHQQLHLPYKMVQRHKNI